MPQPERKDDPALADLGVEARLTVASCSVDPVATLTMKDGRKLLVSVTLDDESGDFRFRDLQNQTPARIDIADITGVTLSAGSVQVGRMRIGSIEELQSAPLTSLTLGELSALRSNRLAAEDYKGYLATVPTSSVIYGQPQRGSRSERVPITLLTAEEEIILFARLTEYRLQVANHLFGAVEPKTLLRIGKSVGGLYRDQSDREDLHSERALEQFKEAARLWVRLHRAGTDLVEAKEKISAFFCENTHATRMLIGVTHRILDDPKLARPGVDLGPLSTELEKLTCARDVAVVSNLRLAWSEVWKFVSYRGCFRIGAELATEAEAGLLTAVDRFDIREGAKFSTYATWWVKQGLHRAYHEQKDAVPIPNYIYELRGKLFQEEKKLAADNFPSSFGISHPDVVAFLEHETPRIAARLEISPETVVQIRALRNRRITSIDTPIGAKGDGDFGDLVPDPKSESPSEEASKLELRKIVAEFVRNLPERESEIMSMRYGLNGEMPSTLEEVSAIMGVTRERIRQIQVKAERRMYKRLRVKLVNSPGILSALGLTLDSAEGLEES